MTILVMDDDDALRRGIVLALETEGYTVLPASGVQEAEALYERADLLLLDVMVPDGSGIELCTRLRTERGVKTPVLFLSSCSDESDIIRGLDSGGDDYITKPFRLRELLSRVRACLRRAAPPVPPPLPELTATEQKLLDYLMQNEGHFLTRDQLLAYLWDSKGVFVNDNTLSVSISRLRDKLRAAGCGQIITKRGMGYKWTSQTD